MDNNSANPPNEGDELRKLEEELKTIDNPQGGPVQGVANIPTSPPVPPLPVQQPASAMPAPDPMSPPQNPSPVVEQTKPKGSKMLFIAIGFLVIAILGAVLFMLFGGGSSQKACTLEAKICPDGSSVGRVGPNCEFAACPSPLLTSTPTPTASSSATPTATGSGTPAGSATATPSGSPTATPSATPTATP